MTDAVHKRWLFWAVILVLFCTFISLIHSILLPFVLGAFMAYFLNPAADKLEKHGFSRLAATLVITVSFFLLLLLLSFFLVPLIIGQFSGLIAAFPSYVAEFDQKYTPMLTNWLGDFPAANMQNIKSAITDFSGIMVKFAGEFITGLFHSGMAIVNVVLLILITPVVASYLLRDWERIISQLYALLPREHEETIREQLAIIDRTLAGFVRGQLNVCLIMATYYAIALSLVGLTFGAVIGFATGLLIIVPYAGQLLGFTIAVAVAFSQFDNYQHVGMVIAVFMLGQPMEGYFLTPKLVGGKVGLHPVWIIFGMLSGAALFGFVGVLLAVPATAVIGVLIRFAIDRYLHSEYYKGSKPRPRKTK